MCVLYHFNTNGYCFVVKVPKILAHVISTFCESLSCVKCSVDLLTCGNKAMVSGRVTHNKVNLLTHPGTDMLQRYIPNLPSTHYCPAKLKGSNSLKSNQLLRFHCARQIKGQYVALSLLGDTMCCSFVCLRCVLCEMCCTCV